MNNPDLRSTQAGDLLRFGRSGVANKEERFSFRVFLVSGHSQCALLILFAKALLLSGKAASFAAEDLLAGLCGSPAALLAACKEAREAVETRSSVSSANL